MANFHNKLGEEPAHTRRGSPLRSAFVRIAKKRTESALHVARNSRLQRKALPRPPSRSLAECPPTQRTFRTVAMGISVGVSTEKGGENEDVRPPEDVGSLVTKVGILSCAQTAKN